jgi:ribosome-binding protein aMBF1 (putative translation factor)
MTAQIVEIAGHKMAVLPIEEYEHLVDLVEDKEDVFAAERAERRRIEGEEYLPAEMIDRILDGEPPLRVWREYRGLTRTALAERVGTSVATISRLESGDMIGDRKRWRPIADALGVSLDDLLPDD